MVLHAAVGTTWIAGLVGEHAERQQYSVRLLFPQEIAVDVVAVEGSWPDTWNIHCFIGRDVLQHGLLIYNGMTNMFSLIF